MSEHEHEHEEAQRLVERARRLYSPAPWLVPAAVVCLLLGVVVLVLGAIFVPGRTWGAMIANYLFWAGVAQAVVVLAGIFQIAPSRWGRVFQRVSLPVSIFLPFSLVVFALLRLGCPAVYPWMHGVRAGFFLFNPTRLWVLESFGLVIMTALSMEFLYRALRVDVGTLREQGHYPAGQLQWLTRNWRGAEQEQLLTRTLMHNLSPAIIVGYAWFYSLLTYGLSMSVDPSFHSTMYGGIYFMGELYAATALTAILAALWRRREGFDEIMAPKHSLDLGNLTWSFAIFWAYVSWSQYIVIWMANLPYEAHHVIFRYRTPPWNVLSWVALSLTWALPFLTLFNRRIKKTPDWLAIVATMGVVGILLQRFLDVMPFIPSLGAPTFGLVELGISLGFLGAVALPYLWLIRRVPLFPVEDPVFFKAVAVRHVEV